MEGLLKVLVGSDKIGEFLDNWEKILVTRESGALPFKEANLIITYEGDSDQPIIYILQRGVSSEIYPCLPETREAHTQIPTFFAEVANYLKMNPEKLEKSSESEKPSRRKSD